MRPRSAIWILALACVLSACDLGGTSSVPTSSRQNSPTPALPSPSPGMRFQEFRPLAQATAIAGLTATADGSAWFTEVNRNVVGRISPAGTYTEYPLPSPDRQPSGIATGPDGGVWFAEENADQLGHLTLEGKLAEYGSGITPTTQPWHITKGPDGNMWFSEAGQEPPLVNRVAKITPSGQSTQYQVRIPDQITAGPDGAIYFSSSLMRLGRITPDGSVTYLNVPGGTIQSMVAGPDGAIWAAMSAPATGARVARITPAGNETDFSVPGAARALSSITLGPDGALWFCDPDASSLGRITTSGEVKEFPMGVMAPGLVAAGAGQTLWLALTNGHIVKVTLA